MKLYDEQRCLQVKKIDDIFQAMDITDEIAQETGFLQYDILFLRLVTEEACMNAYEYCQHTEQQGFFISWDKKQEDCLTIFVKHKGKRFNIIPYENEVNQGDRGRGLKLIVNLMDHVHVAENGEYVELIMRKFVTQYFQREGTAFYDHYCQ